MKAILTWFRRSALLFSLIYISCTHTRGADIFTPSPVPQKVTVTHTDQRIRVDGKLEEEAWQLAQPAGNFIQMEPVQGEPARFLTEVRVLKDSRNLYFGVFVSDSAGRKGIRVNNLKRDFEVAETDYFGILIDPFHDHRNSMCFVTNPYGTQHDFMSPDGRSPDTDWNGIWTVKTQITSEGWVAEFAIPWSTLRFNEVHDSVTWGINFIRSARRIYEISTWSPVPRTFMAYRMEYAGDLVLDSSPKPSSNLQMTPYLLGSGRNTTFLLKEENRKTVTQTIDAEAGGEIKWAISPQTILDVTINTDFAQADVDAAVTNFERASVYFPEKRQFFLENAGSFAPSFVASVEIYPYYSRRIGLDDDGNPIPIMAGARIASRNHNQFIGGMIMRTMRKGLTPASDFGIFRYSRNLEGQNRIGTLATVRWDERIDSIPDRQNVSLTFDGNFQLNRSVSWNVLASGTGDFPGRGYGYAVTSYLTYQTGLITAWLIQSVSNDAYNPGVGFVSRDNVIYNAPGFELDLRPRWKPRWIHNFMVAFWVETFHNTNDLKLTQSWIVVRPLNITFANGAGVRALGEYTKQILTVPFYPAGIEIAPGIYSFYGWRAGFNTDLSRKIGFRFSGKYGGFYDGVMNSYYGWLFASPIPYISLILRGEYHQIKRLGVNNENKDIVVLGPELRLAINPKIQLSVFYQQNTLTRTQNWNVRFSWEFRPMSNIFLVFNSNAFEDFNVHNEDQNLITKVTYNFRF